MHKMDGLPSAVQTLLNLAALLGTKFELLDLIIVMEQYNKIDEKDRLVHAKSVHGSLTEAVKGGILIEDSTSERPCNLSYANSHPYNERNATYKFAHGLWRNAILKLTLDGWKRDMQIIILESKYDDAIMLKKLFSVWKKDVSRSIAAELALLIGEKLTCIGHQRYCVEVIKEALTLWDNSEFDQDIASDELCGAVALHIAMGKSLLNLWNIESSRNHFSMALSVSKYLRAFNLHYNGNQRT